MNSGKYWRRSPNRPKAIKQQKKKKEIICAYALKSIKWKLKFMLMRSIAISVRIEIYSFEWLLEALFFLLLFLRQFNFNKFAASNSSSSLEKWSPRDEYLCSFLLSIYIFLNVIRIISDCQALIICLNEYWLNSGYRFTSFTVLFH